MLSYNMILNSTFRVLTPIAGLVLILGCERATVTSEFQKNVKSAVAQKVALQISLPRTLRSSGPVPLEMTLKNQRTTNVYILEGLVEGVPWPECSVQVFDSKNKPVPYTVFGQAAAELFLQGHRIVTVTLQPGESHTWTIDLVRGFTLVAGGYSLNALFKPYFTRTGTESPIEISISNFEFELVKP